MNSDWPNILALADRASPWKAADNPIWLQNRKNYPEDRFTREHVEAEGPAGDLLAYAALEGGLQAGWFRVFLVLPPAELPTVGEQLYAWLAVKWQELAPGVIWLREEAGDADLLAFMAAKGFVETHRGRYEHLSIVAMELRLQHDG